MTDRPILFRGAMIRAHRENRKTMTRRMLRPQPEPCSHKPWPGMHDEPNWVIEGNEMHCAQCGNGMRLARNPEGVSGIPLRFAKGDRLWVREAWRTEARYDHLKPRDVPVGSLISYEADYDREPNNGCRGRYRHGRFMMRWMSRITDTVTDVRVERLQDISEVDAIAEGIERTEFGWRCYLPEPKSQDAWSSPIESYRTLWTTINGASSWDANPWVTATTFIAGGQNIDALPSAAVRR